MNYIGPSYITMVRNITFEDTGCIDTSQTGHPVLIIHQTNEHLYFLSMTSNPSDLVPQEELEFAFFPIQIRESRFKKGNSNVNLRTIYKIPYQKLLSFEKIPFKTYCEIIEKLRIYQSQEGCYTYEFIKESIPMDEKLIPECTLVSMEEVKKYC